MSTCESIAEKNPFSLMTHAESALLWPEHILIYKVESDCMEETFQEGDCLAVDTDQRDPREGVFLLDCGDGVHVIRRVSLGLNGWSVGCDNKSYGPPRNILTKGLSEAIIGRVVFAEKRIF